MDVDGFVDATSIENAERGDEFLGAGHSSGLIRILGVKHAAAGDIHHDGALGDHAGRCVSRDGSGSDGFLIPADTLFVCVIPGI